MQIYCKETDFFAKIWFAKLKQKGWIYPKYKQILLLSLSDV